MTIQARIPFLVACFAVAAPALAGLPVYSEFELQARSNIVDGFNLPAASSFNSKTPALNNDATIAFSLIIVGGGDAGLFTGSGMVGGVVYSAPADRLLGDPSINAAGAIAFEQFDIFSDGVFVYDPVTGMTTLTIPATFDFSTGEHITDDGDIGHRVGNSGAANSWRLFDGNSTTYATEGSGSISFLFTPATNNAGRIAGKVRLNNNNNDAPDEIRVYDGPGSFTIMASDTDADAGSAFSSFDNSVSLSNAGQVAFIANTSGGDRGVFLTNGTTTTTIALESDPDVSDVAFFPPAVNDSGLVVFRGQDGAGLYAVFVGDGATLQRVIGEHDLIATDLGSARIDQHDNSVTFGGAVAINNNGDLAFNATLTPEGDDQVEWGSGMFIAYAGSGPEVPTVSQWGLGMLAVLLTVAAAIILEQRRVSSASRRA